MHPEKDFWVEPMRMAMMTCLLLLVLAPAAAGQSVGAAIFIEGQASVVRSSEPVVVHRSAESNGLKKRVWLFPGDRIDAENGARVVLTLFARSRFDLEGETSVQIVERGIELLKGKVTSLVYAELLRDDETYEIRGPDTVARFRETASMEVETVTSTDGVSRSTATMICAGGPVRVALLNGTTINLDPEECVRIQGNPQRIDRSKLPGPTAVVPQPVIPKRHP